MSLKNFQAILNPKHLNEESCLFILDNACVLYPDKDYSIDLYFKAIINNYEKSTTEQNYTRIKKIFYYASMSSGSILKPNLINDLLKKINNDKNVLSLLKKLYIEDLITTGSAVEIPVFNLKRIIQKEKEKNSNKPNIEEIEKFLHQIDVIGDYKKQNLQNNNLLVQEIFQSLKKLDLYPALLEQMAKIKILDPQEDQAIYLKEKQNLYKALQFYDKKTNLTPKYKITDFFKDPQAPDDKFSEKSIFIYFHSMMSILYSFEKNNAITISTKNKNNVEILENILFYYYEKYLPNSRTVLQLQQAFNDKKTNYRQYCQRLLRYSHRNAMYQKFFIENKFFNNQIIFFDPKSQEENKKNISIYIEEVLLKNKQYLKNLPPQCVNWDISEEEKLKLIKMFQENNAQQITMLTEKNLLTVAKTIVEKETLSLSIMDNMDNLDNIKNNNIKPKKINKI